MEDDRESREIELRAARRLASALEHADLYRRAKGMAFLGVTEHIDDPDLRSVAQEAVERLRAVADEARARAAEELAELAMDLGLQHAVEALLELDAESGVDDGVSTEEAARRVVREIMETRRLKRGEEEIP
jgi:hypothetical protein